MLQMCIRRKNKMIRIITIGILLFACASPSLRAATVLAEGEKGYVYFDGLIYQSDTINTDFSYVEVFYAEPLDVNDAFNLNLYGNQSDTTPYFTISHNTDSSIFSFENSIFTIIPDWRDFEGFIEIEVLAGSIAIDSVYVSVQDNYKEYGGTFQLTTVPLPASIFLFVGGLCIFVKKIKI